MSGHVTQKFIDKVIRFSVIDTKRYRYYTKYSPRGDVMVYRVPIDYLDTTAVLDRKNHELLYTLLNV